VNIWQNIKQIKKQELLIPLLLQLPIAMVSIMVVIIFNNYL